MARLPSHPTPWRVSNRRRYHRATYLFDAADEYVGQVARHSDAELIVEAVNAQTKCDWHPADFDDPCGGYYCHTCREWAEAPPVRCSHAPEPEKEPVDHG